MANYFAKRRTRQPAHVTYEFDDKILTCSPTTLRYTKVLLDLATLFDFNRIQTVAEIGIGYGGQCRLLMNLLPVARYELIDLPEVLALSEKFLNALDVTGDIRYIDGTHLYHDEPCDLVICNQSIVEFDKKNQVHYIEKILYKAKAGYVSWDAYIFRDPQRYHGYSLEEFAAMIPDSKIIPEYPVTTFSDNQIIVWGTK